MNRRVGQLGLGWVESSEGNQGESLKLSLVAHSSSKRGAGGTQGLLQNTGSELSESGGQGGSRDGEQRATSSLGYLKPQVKTGDHNLPRHGC